MWSGGQVRGNETETCVPALEALELVPFNLMKPGVLECTDKGVFRDSLANGEGFKGADAAS